MTTTSNPISLSGHTAKRGWTIIVGAALGIGAATVAAPAVHSESTPARHVEPTTEYSELTFVAEWATAQGLSGLSPASLRSPTD